MDIVLDKNYLDECWKYYDEHRENPFGLLINLKNQHSCSFEGSRDTETHPLAKKTAFLCKKDNFHAKKHLSLLQQVKEMTGHFWNPKIFSSRNEAIEWLSEV